MKKIIIFGNSGSGKSTLAKELAYAHGLAHLDLDTLAWEPRDPPSRKPLAASKAIINDFLQGNPQWVIEGCYADLLELLLSEATELVFMDLPIEACMANARQRPWEPHKYESKAAQDANLDMLLSWIAGYNTREDTFSRTAHESLFKVFSGKKTRYHNNEREALS